MNQDLINRKRRSTQSIMESMPSLIDKIRHRIKPINLKGCYNNLSTDHLSIGFFKYFIEGDITSLKQNLYTACQLQQAAIEIDNQHEFSVGSEIFYALLSDSTEMINAMAKFEPEHFVSARANPLYSQFKVHMWQLAIRGDYEGLEQKIHHLSKNGRKNERQLSSEKMDFFSLLIKKDRKELEKLIHQHANTKDEHAITEDFLSYTATFEAKLCWYKGIPVEIDHPKVPMELMPIRPLAHYDDVYDFLQPGWVPPPQGLMEKLTRWLGKRA